MARALDGCLAVYPEAEFRRVAEAKLEEFRARWPRERDAARAFLSGAWEFTADSQGRAAIPPKLREYAALDRDVIVAGAYDHVEIWDSQRFREHETEGISAIANGEGLDDFM